MNKEGLLGCVHISLLIIPRHCLYAWCKNVPISNSLTAPFASSYFSVLNLILACLKTHCRISVASARVLLGLCNTHEGLLTNMRYAMSLCWLYDG